DCPGDIGQQCVSPVSCPTRASREVRSLLFKVEKGIPVPPVKQGPYSRYPWLQMEVGDSFFVPGVEYSAFKQQPSNAGRRYGRKYASRSVDGGVRVWRVE